MKNLSIISGLLFLSTIVMTSCGGADVKENEYLGELPSIVKNYESEIDEKKKEAKESTDMEKAFELEKEKDLLDDEMDQAIEDYVNENPELINKELPFETLPDNKYTVNKVTVSQVSTRLNLLFSLTINEDIKNKYGGIEKFLFIYFKAVDSNGETIPETISVATSFGTRDPLVAGAEYDVSGSLLVEHLEDFSKIVQITKEEYEENK